MSPTARLFSVALLALTLLASCAGVPALPPGTARLIVTCCELLNDGDHVTCETLDHDLPVRIDDRDAGTCLTWPTGGTIIAAGGHKIAVQSRLPLGEQGDCCQDEAVTLAIAAGETHTEDFRLNVLDYPD